MTEQDSSGRKANGIKYQGLKIITTQQSSCYNGDRQVEHRTRDRCGRCKGEAQSATWLREAWLDCSRRESVSIYSMQSSFGESLHWTSCPQSLCLTLVFGLQFIYDTISHIPQIALYCFYMPTTEQVIPSCRHKVSLGSKYWNYIAGETKKWVQPSFCLIRVSF